MRQPRAASRSAIGDAPWRSRIARLKCAGSAAGVEGRTALVTGGTSGIGAAIARRFADAGASVVALGLDADGAHVPIHPRVCCIELDVTDVDALSGTIASQLRLAALVNGVGISRDASEYRMDVFEHVLNTNPTPSTSRILP